MPTTHQRLPRAVACLAAGTIVLGACSATGSPPVTAPSGSATSGNSARPAGSAASSAQPALEPAAMTEAGLTAYEKFFGDKASAAMSAANNPPYRTEALDAVFTGGQRETARFKSIYYRTDRDTEKRTIRLIGTGPLYSLPRSGGTDAAMAHVRLETTEGGSRTSVEQLALLVRSRGSSTWRAAALMEVPYADQLPAPAPSPRAPTAAEEKAATDLVGRVIAYVEKGTMPEGVTLGFATFDARRQIERADGEPRASWDVSLFGTGVARVGPGAPITVVPVADGILGVAQLVRTVEASEFGAPSGEGSTDIVYRKRLPDGRVRTRDALTIAFVIPRSGTAKVIASDLGLMLPAR